MTDEIQQRHRTDHKMDEAQEYDQNVDQQKQYKTPMYRITDLYQPELLSVIQLPVLPPPRNDHRSSFDDQEKGVHAGHNDHEQHVISKETIKDVLSLLGKADISSLKPIIPPKPCPEHMNPSMEALALEIPDIFVLNKHERKQHMLPPKAKRRQVTLPNSISPIQDSRSPFAARGSPCAWTSPGSPDERPKKKSRTSLKLNLAPAEKAAFAPTPLEEAALLGKRLAEAIRHFCSSVKNNQNMKACNGGEHDEDSEMTNTEHFQKNYDPEVILSELRNLSDVVVRAFNLRSSVDQVSHGSLSLALRNLCSIMNAGKHLLLEPNDKETDAHVCSILSALESSTIALRLSICCAARARDEGPPLVSDEVIESIIETLKFQLHHNILPYYDVRLRNMIRPDLGSGLRTIKEEESKHESLNRDVEGRKSPSPKKWKRSPNKPAATRENLQYFNNGKLIIPSFVDAVRDRIQANLSLLPELISAVKISSVFLSPIIRTLVSSLTMDDLSTLQARVVSMLASICRNYVDLRKNILKEIFMNSLPYFGSTKNPRRTYVIGDCSEDGSVAQMHVISGALLQIIQASVKLPSLETKEDLHAVILKAYGAPVQITDYFWSLCLDKLQSAKAIKADTDHDFAGVLLAIIQDILLCMEFPQWPAASTLVLRLAASLNSSKGLYHQDASVKQTCIDILGRILCYLYSTDAKMQLDSEWLDALAEENGFNDIYVAATDMLLKFLSDSSQQHRMASETACRSARTFLLTKNLSEDATLRDGNEEYLGEETNLKHSNADHNLDYMANNKILELLTKYREKEKEMETLNFETGLSVSSARRLMRPIIHSAFSKASSAMLSWLLDMLNSQAQTSLLRSRIVKVLGDLAAVNPEILQLSAVQAAVEQSLKDEAISVREASISLLGKHMVTDEELSMALLDTVIQASEDPGSSVRRSAINILRDCAIKVPGFPRAADAACSVLARIADPEESVRLSVARIVQSTWFGNCASNDKRESASKKKNKQTSEEKFGSEQEIATVQQQASLLAEVAKSAYESGGSTIRLPFDSQHPLVASLHLALSLSDTRNTVQGRTPGSSSKSQCFSNHLEISQALLDILLALQTGTHSNGFSGKSDSKEDTNLCDEAQEEAEFSILLALHALSLADPVFVSPPDDPARFLRALTPLIKISPDSKYPTELERRRSAERLLCVVSIIEAILRQQIYLDDSLGAFSDMPQDLLGLINQHRYTQVVAGAIKCLAALSERSSLAAKKLYQTAAVYFSWLQSPERHSSNNLPRFLFILGNLARYGADIIDSNVENALESRHSMVGEMTLDGCLTLFIGYWDASYDSRTEDPAEKAKLKTLEGQVRRYALEAVGQLAIARPLVLVEASSDAKTMLREALSLSSPPQLKLAALSMLMELLQADADALVQRQKTEKSAGSASKRNVSSKKHKKKKALKGKKRNHMDDDEDEDFSSEEEGKVDFHIRADRALKGAVAIENGEGDTLSQSSAILQQHWDAILKLATSRSFKNQTPKAVGKKNNEKNESEMSVSVRRRVIGLTEIVLRDGLVGPWTVVPVLVALCTDNITDIRTRALRLLSQLSDKHPQYADADKLCAGLRTAFQLHFVSPSGMPKDANIDERVSSLPRLLSPNIVFGLGAVYSKLIQTSRPRRTAYLRALLQPFRTYLSSMRAGVLTTPPNASSVEISPPMRKGKGVSSVLYLIFVSGAVACLPFKKGEEPCLVIKEISGIISSHLDATLLELSEDIEELVSGDGGDTENFNASSKDSFVNTYRAGAILCVLDRLRSFLHRSYNISHERLAEFAAAGNRKTVEDGIAVNSSLNPIKDFQISNEIFKSEDINWDPENAPAAKKLLDHLEAMHQEALADE